MRPMVLLSMITLMLIPLIGCTSTPAQPPLMGPALIFFYTEG